MIIESMGKIITFIMESGRLQNKVPDHLGQIFYLDLQINSWITFKIIWQNILRNQADKNSNSLLQ